MHVVKSFLYTTVRNSCLDVLKHRSVIQKFRDQLETEPIDDRDIENEMIRAEVLSELFEAITHLPQGCRQILEMSFLDGRKNQEISDELGISINTVKTQKQRALQLLRLKLTSRTFSFFYMTFLS
jgi:RNA polymerase sigma factor (sigma-70 family)